MAEEHCNAADPHENHLWLTQFVGEWTFVSESRMGPDQPVINLPGSESVRSFGGFWILGEGQGEMPDGTKGNMLLTLGYDVARACFTGSWIGTMMTNLWVYQGSLDPERRVLTLDTEGPGMDGGTSKYQDIHEIVNEDHRVLRSRMLGEDGKWIQFNESNYHRK